MVQNKEENSMAKSLHKLPQEQERMQSICSVRKRIRNCWKLLNKIPTKNSFGETISFVHKDKPLPRNNPLIKYNPFIDEKGILRIGGRLKNSYLESKTINPIILHGKNKLTEDLITETHKLHGHMGRETIMSAIRSKYWIVSLNSVIKRILFNCTTCHRLNGQPSLQKWHLCHRID